MDLKQLAAERLRQLLRDATGQEPGKWRHGMQQRVAELLGVHASLISTTEHGGRDRLGLEALGKIQDKTGISPMYFLVENIIAGGTYRDFLAPGRKDPFREFRPEDDGSHNGIVITAETLLQKADDLQRLADQLRTEAQQHGRAISDEGRQAVSRSLTPAGERQRSSTAASEPRRLPPPRHATSSPNSPRPKPGAARSKN